MNWGRAGAEVAAQIARGRALLGGARRRDADGGARLLEVLLRRLVLAEGYRLRLYTTGSSSGAPASMLRLGDV